jgi:hypothetical protein
MIDGKNLAEAGFRYLGVPYSRMDCQAFAEQCLRDCGLEKNLAGSNAWYREVMKNGAVMTPEECVRELGKVPAGAFLFILSQDGGEPAKYKPDGLGNASHIGICTGRGEGAIHSAASRGCVAESKFKGKSISGGWNRVGLWNEVSYDYGNGKGDSPESVAVPDADSLPGSAPVARPVLRKGCRGEAVQALQARLMTLGYDLGPCGADGIFGRRTRAAVRAFQRDRGIRVDGIAGPVTWGRLYGEE